jgi:L-ascorbate metabolism protein UlaG (beta-lactamase superfamily)
MLRSLAALALTAVLAPGTTDQARPALEARFIGNMAFAITDGSTTLMTDFPYQSGYSRYMTYDPKMVRSATPTLSLITHRHGDHWERSLFMATDWKVAGPADVTVGISPARVVPVAKGSFGPIGIEAIETPHASIGHYSYIVSWHGRRLYFSGDTESPDSLLAARNLDAAFVSPWQYRAALRSGKTIDAKQIVIYHHESGQTVAECGSGCTVPRQGDVLRF